MTEAALLRRMRESPYAGAWLARARLGLDVDGARWTWSPAAALPWDGRPVDAWLRCTEADLVAMLAGRPPEGDVGYALGDRDLAPRLRQAHALLGLAALGWCGPWPDAAVDREHVRLVREALLDLAVGPGDGRRPLFPAGAPHGLDRVTMRFTDGAARRWATAGLADEGPGELVTDAGPRALRIAALHLVEHGSLPARLDTDEGTLAISAGPLPLPHRIGTLWTARVG